MDLRYHVITLIAVFLALAAGVLVGGAVSGSQQQNRALESVVGQMDALREEDQRIRVESALTRSLLSARDDGLRDLLPLALADRLTGARVAVVVCGKWDSGAMLRSLRARLTEAGASVTSVTSIPPELTPLTAEQERRHEPYAGFTKQDESLAATRPLHWLARYLVRGEETRLKGLARDAGYRLRGRYNLPIRRVLLLCRAAEDEPTASPPDQPAAATALVEAFRGVEARVVATEPEDAVVSLTDALARAGAVTVDNGDTPLGELATVLALAGADGRFGSKPGAERPLPPLD